MANVQSKVLATITATIANTSIADGADADWLMLVMMMMVLVVRVMLII
jgi:hypothetical protein